MKKYFVRYDRDFANAYSLCWTNGETPDGWERITRNKAEDLARAEARRRREDPSFSGYADDVIVPIELVDSVDELAAAEAIDDAKYSRKHWRMVGRVLERV